MLIIKLIEEVGKLNAVNEINHGVSIKLSALHPRFETLKYKYVKAELFESVSALVILHSHKMLKLPLMLRNNIAYQLV